MRLKLTLKARISAVIGFLCVLPIVIGLLGLYGINKANEGLKTVYEEHILALEKISQIDSLLLRNRLALAEAILDPIDTQIQVKASLIEKNTAEIERIRLEYRAFNLTAKEQQLAEQFFADSTKMLTESLHPALLALRGGQIDTAAQLQERFQAMIPTVMASVDALKKLQVEDTASVYQQSKERYVLLRAIVIVVFGLGAFTGASIGFFLVRNIYRQLGGEPEYAAQIARSIAAGDLTIEVVTREGDQQSLLFAMQTMHENLVHAVGKIRQSADTIFAASAQIAAGNLELSSRTEEQADSLEKTASSMEELTATVKQNATNAAEANQLASSTSNVAVKGGALVEQMVNTMVSISESSKKITDIVGVIDSIAFQTNILALNAAVEAARAGEHGRGFAVVAGEVRNLAHRSAGAAKEIKAMIADSTAKVKIGAQVGSQTGATMQEIVRCVQRVATIMSEIAEASHEQGLGIEHVSLAIAKMDQIAQQNSAQVEEVAAAAESMRDETTDLALAVSLFKLDIAHAAVTSYTASDNPLGSGAQAIAQSKKGSVTRLRKNASPGRVAAANVYDEPDRLAASDQVLDERAELMHSGE